MIRMQRLAALLLALVPFGCVGGTGGDLLTLDAYAAGPPDADGSLRFESGRGYQVELTEARIFVGGVYLNQAQATSVASETSCGLAGIYVTQVLGGRQFDLLSAERQAFPSPGFSTTDRALTGEVWLTSGDVNQPSSSTVVLRVAGKAERDGQSYPFEGALTIGENRAIEPTSPALPGQYPICKQRIVSPIPLELKPTSGSSLVVRIDPRPMFANVDFKTLSQSGDGYVFADEPGVDQASDNLYAGLRRSTGVYTFSLESKE
ncbi:MAG TPA: hypothetical protein VIW29_21315 [Polyangiaceae bacterium]